MAFLLRIELPDVPGALGAVATALGEAGADITAVEVVEHRDGWVVDDVLLDLQPPDLPDRLVSACQSVDGVRVHWVSRYAAGDRKSTRLNSSHVAISYAVFCLKKKNQRGSMHRR